MMVDPVFRYNARHLVQAGLDLVDPELAKGIERRKRTGGEEQSAIFFSRFRPTLPSSWEAMSMTRIHQQASSTQHERWYQFGTRCVQEVKRASWVFTVLAFLVPL